METDLLRDPEAVKARWEGIGLHEDGGPVIFYCGTGWRSSISFLLAHIMGWESKNYDDGWYGWSMGVGGRAPGETSTDCGCDVLQNGTRLTVPSFGAEKLPR